MFLHNLSNEKHYPPQTEVNIQSINVDYQTTLVVVTWQHLFPTIDSGLDKLRKKACVLNQNANFASGNKCLSQCMIQWASCGCESFLSSQVLQFFALGNAQWLITQMITLCQGEREEDQELWGEEERKGRDIMTLMIITELLIPESSIK